MSNIKIILPSGAMGKSANDGLLEKIIRCIAEEFSNDPEGEWAEKYGTEVSNNVFVMHPFCWFERYEFPYCFDYEQDENNNPLRFPSQDLRDKYGIDEKKEAPNFWYKPLDFKVWWYKYIGRGMEINKRLTKKQLGEILSKCLSKRA